MHCTLFALAALVASAAASLGNAVIINSCSYDVGLQNTPASGGGYEIITETIALASGSYSQTWTELSNGAGWSMKLWPLVDGADAETVPASIMQYEYTLDSTCGVLGDCLDDIWYDLSDVNGNPWNGNWEITADGNCNPFQAAYRYSTDDKHGMQTCDSNSTITVTLCSGDSAETTGSAASSAAASTTASSTSTSAYSAISTSSSTTSTTAAATTATSSTTSAESSTSTSSSKGHNHPWTGAVDKAVVAATTLATSVVTTTSAGDDLIVTVTEIDTVIATATVIAEKRAEHVHQHAARHPHGRR